MRRPSARCTPNTVTISRVSWGRDAAGGREKSYGDPGPAVRCSVQAVRSELVELHKKVQKFTAYEVLFHDDPGLGLLDRLTWIDGVATLTVTGVADSAGRHRTWVAYADDRPASS